MSSPVNNYVLLGVFVIMVAANIYIISGSGNARLRKVMLVVFSVLGGALALVWLKLAGFSSKTFYLLVPAVVVLCVLNLRQFKICDDCGSCARGSFFRAPEECDSCGAKFQPRTLE
jgi:hypothetical protein